MPYWTLYSHLAALYMRTLTFGTDVPGAAHPPVHQPRHKNTLSPSKPP